MKSMHIIVFALIFLFSGYASNALGMASRPEDTTPVQTYEEIEKVILDTPQKTVEEANKKVEEYRGNAEKQVDQYNKEVNKYKNYPKEVGDDYNKKTQEYKDYGNQKVEEYKKAGDTYKNYPQKTAEEMGKEWEEVKKTTEEPYKPKK